MPSKKKRKHFLGMFLFFSVYSTKKRYRLALIKKVRSMSVIHNRETRKKRGLDIRTIPAQKPLLRLSYLFPSRYVINTVPIAAIADGNRAPNSFIPKTL
nr:hypothetical protein [Candidatus Kuenenia stuttgartiensis]